MASLEEIRKRFAKTSTSAPEAAGPAAQLLADATLKIFDPLKRFEVQVSEIMKVAEPLERLLNQTARTLDEVKTFRGEMERLSRAYDGIKTFQAALSSDASRELREHFDGIARVFHENLATAAALLEPAREFQQRIAELAKVFDGLKPLQDQFNSLAAGFKSQAAVETPKTIVLDQPAATAAIANAAISAAGTAGNGRTA